MTKSSTPDLGDLPLAFSANMAMQQFQDQVKTSTPLPTGAELLYERANLMGLAPQNGCSPNGSCHLIEVADGILAVNLPRKSDWELVPAWLGPWCASIQLTHWQWGELQSLCRDLRCDDLLQQAKILGLAVTRADDIPSPPPSPVKQQLVGCERRTKASLQLKPPLVVDLSSLWAGPLCGQLLHRAGCRVIKVEATSRLDGARQGCHHFYQLLNQGKESITLDFHSHQDIRLLRELLSRADIVIEASRPRALKNLGIDAEALLQSKPGLIWLSITGYGRDQANEDCIGFGDDAAAAAGLCQVMHQAIGEHQFVGDAIADPLTGIYSALHVWHAHQSGISQLLDASLKNVASFCLHRELGEQPNETLESFKRWHHWGGKLDQLFDGAPRPAMDYCAFAGEHRQAVVNQLLTGALD